MVMVYIIKHKWHISDMRPNSYEEQSKRKKKEKKKREKKPLVSTNFRTSAAEFLPELHIPA